MSCAPTADAPAPGQGARLSRSALWTLLGTFAYNGAQGLILVAIARLAGAASVGRFAYAVAITSPVFLLAGLQLKVVQATELSHAFAFPTYARVRAVGSLAALVACAGIAAAFQPEVLGLVLAVSALKIVEGTSELVGGLLQRHDRLDCVSVGMTARGALMIVAMVVALASGLSLTVASWVLAAAALLVLGLYEWPRGRRYAAASDRLAPPVSWQAASRLAWGAAPLGAAALLSALNANVPRYFLEHGHGTYALGVFAAASYLVMAANNALSALTQAAMVRLARIHSDGRRGEFLRFVGILVAVVSVAGALLTAVAAVGGTTLMVALFGPDFADSGRVLAWTLATGTLGFVATVLTCAANAARSYRFQFGVAVVQATVTVAMSAVLVPSWGAVGAAWACGIGWAVQVVGLGLWIAQDRPPRVGEVLA